MKKSTKIIFLIGTLLLNVLTFQVQGEKITVVAAANMKVALDYIITVYKKQNPTTEIEVIYGASGKLFEQISNDAPFDVFLSADLDFPNKLKARNLTVSSIKIYAIGRLALWSKKMDPNIKKMNSLLDSFITKIAVANPTTAPYGAKAIESMKFYKVYNKVQTKLVYGENIIQTAQFLSFGAADIGIIALSTALTPQMTKTGGKYYIIPEESYKPLEQGCVVLKHAKGNQSAMNFYDFLSNTESINILTYYGYNQKQMK